MAAKDNLSPLLLQIYTIQQEGVHKGWYQINFLTVIGITPPCSGQLSTKHDWLKLLEKQDKEYPGKIDVQLAVLSTAAPLAHVADLGSSYVM